MPYLVYDADCGFCTTSARWIARTGDVAIRPWQSVADLGSLGLSEEMVTAAAYWVADDGSLHPGAQAIARALGASVGHRRLLGRIIDARAVAPLARRVYGWVAANRYRMPGSTDSCALPTENR